MGGKHMLYIAICDDEQAEINNIRVVVEPFLKAQAVVFQVKEFLSGSDLITSKTKYDIIFLDISMEEMNGVEVGRAIYQKNRKVKIIYITSYSEYFDDALNHVHAFAYIQKPIHKEKLINQVAELLQNISEDKKNQIEIEFYNVTMIRNKDLPKVTLPLSSIIYFEYVKATRKIRVVTEDAVYIFKGTFSDVIKKMEIYDFEICCRGIMVNLLYVMSAKGDAILLNNGDQLSLAPKRAVAFKEKLHDYIHRSVL